MTPRPCVYCAGAKVVENAVYGRIACRVCLGTGVMPEEPYNLGIADTRVLRRIAELMAAAGET